MIQAAFDEHQKRLETLIAFAETPDPTSQIRHVLHQAQSALHCEHVEIVLQSERGLQSTSTDGIQVTDVFARSATLPARRLMVFDVSNEREWNQSELARSGIRSLLLWPLSSDNVHAVLIFGWLTQRQSFVSDDEIRYVESLTRILGRLLALADKQEHLSQRLMSDPLTHLRNRTAIHEELNSTLSHAARMGTSAAVFYIDLDEFKVVNDVHGHSAGDRALSVVAQRMRAVLRKHENIGRIGGDEFSIVVREVQQTEELASLARRIIQAVSQPIEAGALQLVLSASIGIALYPQDGLDVESLMRAADEAMYRAKERGKGTFAFYSEHGAAPEQVQRNESSREFSEDDLEHQFILCYQPIVDARTDRVIGAEALLRWMDPKLGIRMPNSFLNHLSKQRMIERLEHWTLRTVCREDLPFGGTHSVPVFLNVSAPQESLARAAQGRRVAFECRESDVANAYPQWLQFMRECRQCGIAVGLADFGSGRLSLRELCELPLNFVKIPADVIAAQALSPNMSLRTVVAQAHLLRCIVIAQAVADASSRSCIAASVDALQGYAICAPLTDSDLACWLEERSGHRP